MAEKKKRETLPTSCRVEGIYQYLIENVCGKQKKGEKRNPLPLSWLLAAHPNLVQVDSPAGNLFRRWLERCATSTSMLSPFYIQSSALRHGPTTPCNAGDMESGQYLRFALQIYGVRLLCMNPIRIHIREEKNIKKIWKPPALTVGR